jgi:outer membrane protein assembly factor BamD
MRIPALIASLLMIISLTGCSLLPKQIDETKGWSASRLYSEAKSALTGDDYETAIRYYELLEARYPFGRYAQQAELEVAYAYYKWDEPESAIAAADRFIKLHPRHPNVDYAYYLKGVINFNRNSGFLERFFPQDLSTRDPGASRQAFFDFRDLVQKFPNSRYAPDARARMLYLRNSLARHEMHVADYYMKRGAYVAVVNRCKYVVEHYDRSPEVPQALTVMAQAYDKMQMPDLANDARRVLRKSYPNYVARQDTKKGWWPF